MWKRGVTTKAPGRTFFWSAKQPRKEPGATVPDQKKTNSEANAQFCKPARDVVEDSKEKQGREKTILEQDEELRLKLEGISGGGGAAGVEYEGGKAVGLKRGVKENIFRVI
ncbi:unnamed protein product [Diplocarpon coronariae]